MKNVTQSMLKTSIFMFSDDFTKLVTHLFPGVQVDYDSDGINYEYKEDSLDTDTLYTKLAEYFNVKEITSIHYNRAANFMDSSDNYDCLGIWITYKD